ncbi:MAG: IPT/TIG domain-containing protein [Candidatus Vogelbacteria bacterium]|nr:IPT/TIG domain-containing protein [Candidatus Vogelbacteria bacterium]
MKKKLAASVFLWSALAINPELLRQLQVLLARLSEILTVQTRPAIIYRSAPEKSVAAPTSTPTVHRQPEISGVTPSRGVVGTTITIRGSGFTPTGNNVYASYGAVVDLPSPDGQTITLTVEPPGLPANLGAIKTETFPELRYRFYIRNGNGETKTPGEFTLDL